MLNREGVFLMIILSLLSYSLAFSSDCERANELFVKANDISDLAERVKMYEEVLSLCPSHVKARNNLGDTYERLGKIDEAIAEYKKAIETDPNYALAYFSLGDVYFKLKKYKEAKDAYEKGLIIKPDDSESREKLSQAQEKLGMNKNVLVGTGLVPVQKQNNVGADHSPELTASLASVHGQPQGLSLQEDQQKSPSPQRGEGKGEGEKITPQTEGIKTRGAIINALTRDLKIAAVQKTPSQLAGPAYRPGREGKGEGESVQSNTAHIDFRNILFEFDSSRLTKDSIAQLNEIGSALVSDELKLYNFQIQGHTDSIGSDEYNLRLSEARALAVRQYLFLKWNVEPERLSSKGFGEEQPVADNSTNQGRAMNRRVSLVVVP